MLGPEITYSDTACIITMPVDDFLYNPQGSYHDGMLATVMDVAMGHLIKKTTGVAGITLEMKNQYLRPLTIGPARCEGRFLRHSRGLSFLEARTGTARIGWSRMQRRPGRWARPPDNGARGRRSVAEAR